MSSEVELKDGAMPWRYSINYGPEGEANWANVYAPDGSCVGNLPTHHAIAIVRAGNASPQLKADDNPYFEGTDPERNRLVTELAERIKTHVHSDPWWVADKAIRILTARRSASPSIGRVGVKALEWRNVDSPDMASGDWWFEAYSPFGNYTITFVERHTLPWLLEPFFSDLDSNYASEDQAKAAAQQDYESRIRSALVYHEEPAGDTQGAEPVAWMYPSHYDGRVELFPNNALWKEHGYAQRHPEAVPLYPHPPAALVSPPDNGEAPADRIEAATKVLWEKYGAHQNPFNSWEATREIARAALQSHNEGSDGK